MQNESRVRPSSSRHIPSLLGLFLSVSGSIILAWVAYITWYDMTQWSKDIGLIFFGSRTGELISLGIGMRLIYYFLIGLTVLLLGLVTLRRNRSVDRKKTETPESDPAPPLPATPQEQEDTFNCSHYLGYLASLPKNSPIPPQCLTCREILECTRRTSR